MNKLALIAAFSVLALPLAAYAEDVAAPAAEAAPAEAATESKGE